jgi:hypothetical protein
LELRVLRRVVVLECYASRIATDALKDMVEPLKTMTGERVEYAPGPDGIGLGTRNMWVKLVNTHLGSTPLTVI